MKKTFNEFTVRLMSIIILTIMIVLLASSCSSNTNTGTDAESETPTGPQKIVLTSENFRDYFSITVDSDVDITTHQGGTVAGAYIPTTYSAVADITVNTSATSPLDSYDVVVTLKVESGAGGNTWESKTITLPLSSTGSASRNITLSTTERELYKSACNVSFYAYIEDVKGYIVATPKQTKPNNNSNSHDCVWGDWKIVSNATCTSEGSKTRTCTQCSLTQKETISRLDHQWQTGICDSCGMSCNHVFSDWEIIIYASCEETGLQTRQCYTCEVMENQTIPKREHDWMSSSLLGTYCRICLKTLTSNDENNTPETPTSNKTYKMYMVQENLGKTLYVNGEMSSYYYDTSENSNDGITIYTEATTGGYFLYYMNGATKTYLNIVQKGSYINATYDTTAISVFTYNSSLQTYVTSINGEEYFYGSLKSGNYTNIATHKVSTASTCFVVKFMEINDTELEANTSYVLQLSDGTYVNSDAYYITTSNGIVKELLGMSAQKSDAAIFNIKNNSDGSISIMLGAKYLYADGEDVMIVSQPSEYTSFVIEKRSNGVLIKCKNATYNGNPQYLEVYYGGYLTCYGLNEANIAIYTFNFIEVNN